MGGAPEEEWRNSEVKQITNWGRLRTSYEIRFLKNQRRSNPPKSYYSRELPDSVADQIRIPIVCIHIIIVHYHLFKLLSFFFTTPIWLYTLVAYIADNMGPDQTTPLGSVSDQTAALGSSLIRVHNICFHDKNSLCCF